MEFSYPVPQKSEILGLFSEKWFDFVSRFKCRQEQNVATRFSFLLHFGAKAIEDMFNNYQLSTGEIDKFSSLIFTLEQECLFQVVLMFLRYLFFNHCRQAGLSVDDFYTELKLLSDLCSFDNAAVDKFIKHHIVNGFQEESIRDMFMNNNSNLTATDVVDICAHVEKRGSMPTADTFQSCIMDRQQNSFISPAGVKKDCGWSIFQFQETQTDMTKGLNLSTVYKVDTPLYSGMSHCEKSSVAESSGKYAPFVAGVNFTQSDTFSDSSSFIPNKVSSFGINFQQTAEVSTGFLQHSQSSALCTPYSYQPESTIASSTTTVPPVHPPQPPHLPATLPPKSSYSVKARVKKAPSKHLPVQTHSSSITASTQYSDTGSCATDATTSVASSAVATAPSLSNNNNAAVGTSQADNELTFEDGSEDCEMSNSIAVDSDCTKAKKDTSNEIPQSYCSQQKALLKTTQIIQSTGQSIDVYTCNFCAFSFSQKAIMENHALQEHKSLKCFVCTVCNSKFPTRDRLDSHVRIKHMNIEEHKCQICDMIFRNQKKLFVHLQGHTETPTVKCRECSAMFTTEKLLSDHMSSVHPDVDRWSCRICSTSFPIRRLLLEHLKTHRKDDAEQSRRFLCKECGIYFTDKKSSDMHKKKYHARVKIRRFPCDVCSHVCSSNANLISHKRVHTGEKPYMCEVCGKDFSQLSSLEKHARVHTGEKPYKCQYCDLRFIASSNRLTHERVHRKERPYICEQCGKTFRNSYELKLHIDTHNAFRPRRFLCHCGAAFDTRRKLRRHEVRHSAVKPYKCELCGASFTRPENVKGHQKSQACRNRLSKRIDAVQP